MNYLRPGPGIDQDGTEITLIPIKNAPGNGLAKLLRADADQLEALGLLRHLEWAWTNKAKGFGYVRQKLRRGYTELEFARWIIMPNYGSKVIYRDGDGLNLRRENLDLKPGKPGDGQRESHELAMATHAKMERDARQGKYAGMNTVERLFAETDDLDQDDYGSLSHQTPWMHRPWSS